MQGGRCSFIYSALVVWSGVCLACGALWCGVVMGGVVVVLVVVLPFCVGDGGCSLYWRLPSYCRNVMSAFSAGARPLRLVVRGLPRCGGGGGAALLVLFSFSFLFFLAVVWFGWLGVHSFAAVRV